MAKEKIIKTNAMRILDRERIAYEFHSYECGEFIAAKASFADRTA